MNVTSMSCQMQVPTISPGDTIIVVTTNAVFDIVIIIVRMALSWTSSFVVPVALVSRLAKSIHLCFSHLLLLLLHICQQCFLFDASV